MLDPVDWAAWTFGKVGHWGLVAFLLIMSAVVGLVWMRGVERYQQQHRPPDSNKPLRELMLLAPTSERAYRWVPRKSLSINQSDYPNETGKLPMFRLKNFSNHALTDIAAEWSVVDPVPITTLILTSPVFGGFKPRIGHDQTTFWLSRNTATNMPKPIDSRTVITNIAMQVADTATTHVEYCEAGSEVDVMQPVQIAGSYAVRLVTAVRGAKLATGQTKREGPLMRVVVRYHSEGNTYMERFRVESEVSIFSDTTGAGTMKNVEREDRSPLNMRARARFRVARD